MPPAVAPPAAPAPAPRTWRGLRIALLAAALAGALAVALAVAAWTFLAGDAGVRFALRELAARSGGRITIEGASGSLLDAVRVRRLVWRGAGAQAVATDVTLTWRPAALWSQGVVVQALGARRLELEIEASDAAAPLPEDLALPFELAIERLAVARLDWRLGPRAGEIRGLALRYAGGAAGHRVANLTLGSDAWTLSGEAGVGAAAPFPVDGRLALAGVAAPGAAAATLTLSGTLAALAVDARGMAGDSRFTAHAALAPLAAVPLIDVAVDAADLDLAAWYPGLPATRLDIVVRAQPAGNGLAGEVQASNALAGALDAGRIPLAALTARFAWRTDALTLDDLAARLPGDGRARGRASIPLGEGGGAGTWSLDVTDVDLKRIYGPLTATRISGRIAADLDRDLQRISGEVAERGFAGGIALDFRAAVTGAAVDVERFRLAAGGGELAGRGRVARAGARAFSVDATGSRFDPARFGAFPAGAIDGELVATGVLSPAWRAGVQLTLAPSSRLAGVALSGTLAGTLTQDSVRDLDVALRAGSAKLEARGSAGGADDALSATLEAPRLADLLPLLPGAVPRTLSGGARATAKWRGPLHGGALDVEARGEALKLSPRLAVGRLDLKFALAAGAARPDAGDLATRAILVDARAADVVGPQGTFTLARARLDGTLARHALEIAFASEEMAIEAAAHGGLARDAPSDTDPGWRWSGTVDALEGTGPLAVRLTAPAAVSYARGRVSVGAARLAVADGGLQLASFTWDEGRITSDGTFTAVPLATAARLAGVPLPVASTLTLGGEWSLAATPRLNGTVSLRREGGDLQLRGMTAAGAAIDPARLAVGITALEVAARFTQDAVDATASFASTRGGSATARAALGAVAGAPPGRISADAPLTLAATAELPTLALLQPWIGTTAVVDGRARAELTGSGRLGRIAVAGTLLAEALRVDAPHYGVHFREGRLKARLGDGNVVVDELVLAAGAGHFRASGTVVAATGANAATAARLRWRATDFRLFNRPDRHLVVGGEGTLAVARGKLEIKGTLRADEGRIVYASGAQATLGDDVVVKGWPRASAPAVRASDMPLAVDLAIDLGDRLSFASEGLDTGLSGTVRVTTGPRGFVGKGTIRAVNGTYRAFGQRLIIDPGRLLFDGPLDNPGLDIVALRKNLAVEAGVAVTGTVRVPIVTLTSNPPVPDSEKLSWLVLGRGLERTSGADLSALQAASALLLGRDSRSVNAIVAESFGVDDIAIRSARGARGGTPDAANSVIAVGKRLSDNLTLVFEQGLTVANSALKIEYALTRGITLRAETGIVSGIGIQYGRSFD